MFKSIKHKSYHISKMSIPTIISIEGNIGTGKSTLVQMLKETYKNYSNVIFLQEPVDMWNTIKDNNGETILSKFYADQEKYAFSFQMMAYISRISLLKKAIKSNPGKIIISERCVLTDRNVFAKMLYDSDKIEEVNYKIYLQWFDEFIEDIPVSGIVYVCAEPEVSHSRVIKRAREGEEIPLEYLRECHEYHERWLDQSNISMITLDGNLDKEYTHAAYMDWIDDVKSFISERSPLKLSTDDIMEYTASGF